MKRVLLLDEKGSRLLYDPLNIKILRILIQSEMSASEVSRKVSIPVVRGWRRLERLREAGIVEVRRIVKVGNIEKKIYGASALRYVPAELLNVFPSDPNLKSAYSLYLQLQRRMMEEQFSLEMEVNRTKNLLDLYIYTDLLAFVKVMELNETSDTLKRIRFHLEEYLKRNKLSGNSPKG
ncbi:MAG: winged helix-turn-helix domain-containing protein [Conexivisphaerales archaeon]